MSFSAPPSPAQTLVLLSTVTADNSATVDVEATFSSTYDTYLLIGSGIRVSDPGVSIGVQMKIGGAYDTAANYVFHLERSSSGAGTYAGNASAGATSIQVFSELGVAAASDAGNFGMYIDNPSSAALKKQIRFQANCVDTSSVHRVNIGSGHNSGTGALTGLRFASSLGTIVAGKFRLYGIANQ